MTSKYLEEARCSENELYGVVLLKCFLLKRISPFRVSFVSSFKFYLSHTRLYRDCITSSEM